MFQKLTKGKLRAKIIRKGMFTQLPYRIKNVEPEHRLFRTILDYTLYAMTSQNEEEKLECFEWLDTNGEDFRLVCFLAGLDVTKTHGMFLFFLKNYFKDIFKEYSCYLEAKRVS